MSLRVLIVDDEAPARRLLMERLKEHPDLEVVGQAESGREALQKARELHPQAVFLDIQMPGLNGLDVAREFMQWETPPRVIFATAYEEHAIAAFELEALDYLLKPVERERLALAVEKLTRGNEEQDYLERVLRAVEAADRRSPLTRLALLDEVAQVRYVIGLEEVCFITTKSEKTYVHLEGRTLRCMETLQSLESRLPPDRFLRSHRAYLVNIDRVTKIAPWSSGTYNLTLRGVAQSIPLSRGQAPLFKERLGWV